MIPKKIALLLLLALILLIGGIALGVTFDQPITRQISSLAKPRVAPTTTKMQGTCTTPKDCRIMYATRVANAVAAIRLAAKDPTLNVTPQGDTLKKDVTVYCSKNKQCWEYDNTTKKVVKK